MRPAATSEGTLFGGRPRHILVVSPQPWEGLKVSKHHYAVELAAHGHRVSFLQPPDLQGARGALNALATGTSNVLAVTYTPWFPYNLKFHARPAFDWAMRQQAKRIARLIGEPEVVWDFDNSYQFADLRAFGHGFRIFHPVDDLLPGRSGRKAADLLLSVSQTFIDRVGGEGHVIPHALSEAHVAHAQAVLAATTPKARGGRPMTVGYVGNLEHPGIDWRTILAMIAQRPDVHFRFFGPAGSPGNSVVPAEALSAAENVELCGPRSAAEILGQADQVDLWLVCYDGAKTINGAINSHKILEYLATGQPVLSNRVAAYEGNDLVLMPPSVQNAPMVGLLDHALSQLEVLQRPAERHRRAAFAAQFSYARNLQTIDGIVAALRSKTVESRAA